MAGHPHADLMAKAAEIAKTDQYWQRNFEEKFHSTDKWNQMSDVFFQTHKEYRLKPNFIDINGHKVPEPVREPLKIGQVYWLARIHGAVDSFEWEGDHECRAWLECGLIHLTKEAAEAHAAALFSFTQK
ncbi:hypothetical protein [Morganella morganii]|uniref:hypothetical protein n=1 Tax=Morganella morganii TaxID=582 RepID=UPI0025A92D1E|nr:hypothetical protein [Morganella morganii]EKW5729303.1 hypothetical protein [Morganella morganii]